MLWQLSLLNCYFLEHSDYQLAMEQTSCCNLRPKKAVARQVMAVYDTLDGPESRAAETQPCICDNQHSWPNELSSSEYHLHDLQSHH